MSECVVRMEMPEKCDECPAWCICGTLHKYMLGIDCESDWTYDDLLVITVETGFVKPDNCPILCQLPEGHGRLVDADALKEWLIEQINYYKRFYGPNCSIMAYAYAAVCQVLNDTTTIVPAEAGRSANDRKQKKYTNWIGEEMVEQQIDKDVSRFADGEWWKEMQE